MKEKFNQFEINQIDVFLEYLINKKTLLDLFNNYVFFTNKKTLKKLFLLIINIMELMTY